MDLKQVSENVQTSRKNSGVEPLRFSSDNASDINILTRTIKEEGLLLRNKGTNSIHSIKIKLDKFENIFTSMEKSLSENSLILQKTLNVMMEENERKNIVDQINLLNQQDRSPTIINKYYGGRNNKNSYSNRNNSDGGGTSFTFLPNILGRGGLSVGKILASLIVVPLLAKVSSDIVENIASSTGFTEEFANTLSDSTFWGILGGGIARAFSKKLGIYGLVAGASWPLGEKMLDAAGIDGDKMVEIMGKNIELDTIAGAIMSATSVGLLSFFKSANFRTALTSNLVRMLGVKGLAIGGAVIADKARREPEIAQDKIEDLTGYRPDKSLTKFGATVLEGSALGMGIGGPRGALIGAGLGVIGGFIEAGIDHQKQAREPIETILSKQKEDPNFTLSPDQRRSLEPMSRRIQPLPDGSIPWGTPLDTENKMKNWLAFEEDNKRNKFKPVDEVYQYIGKMLSDNDDFWRNHLYQITKEGISEKEQDKIINEFLAVLRKDIINGHEHQVMSIIRQSVNRPNSWTDWDISETTPAQVIKQREPFIYPEFRAEQHTYNRPLKSFEGVEFYGEGNSQKDFIDVDTPISNILSKYLVNGNIKDSPEFRTDFYLSQNVIRNMLEEIGFSKEEISKISPSRQIEILSKKINHIDTSAAKKEGNVIVYAPNVTNAPITNITQGGNTVHNKTNIISPIQSPNKRHGGIQ